MVHDLEWATAVMHGWQQHLLLIIIRINTPGYFLWKIMCYFLCLRFFCVWACLFLILKNAISLNMGRNWENKVAGEVIF